ncbi:MAG TPA: phage baseplate assembly protein V [Enhygromyxa sp.]|nr:phage baseplate assembly protein V [Enhygromyxa sp.]
MGIPVATISAGGQTMDPAIDVLSIEVRKQVDKIPEARLVLLDGSVARREFEVSDTAFFEPGKQLRIQLRYEGEKDQQVFEGLIVRQSVEARAEGSELRVELKDAALQLTRQRHSAVYQGKDHEILAKLITPPLEKGSFPATGVQHTQLVQYYASDWDFLLARADVNGQVVIVDDGKVSLRSMTEAPAPVATYRWGLDEIHEFSLELDGGSQWAAITGSAWDQAQQRIPVPKPGKQLATQAGNVDPKQLASKLGGNSYALNLPASLAPAELEPWASARLARSRLAFVRGRLVVPGRADIKPFDRVKLDGVGKRFEGEIVVAGVIQHVDHGGWRTELELGLSPEWFARTPDIADAPAGGLLPPAPGLVIGTVDKFEQDPSGELRVKVRLPTPDQRPVSVLARVARPDAGKDPKSGISRGFVFWPEPGDEVVVGFLADDPRQAVVLGSLHGSKQAPPPVIGPPSADGQKRGLVSKAGTSIVFDDAKGKPSLTLATAGNNTIVIDDGAASIEIRDQHGNAITMNADGITLKSANKFTIDAPGAVLIKGATVDIK